MYNIKYGLFYDNHTHMENPDAGKDSVKLLFDILLEDGARAWDDCKLLILPEDVPVDDLMEEKIRKHVAGDGAFFCSGRIGAEVFGSMLGIGSVEESGMDPVHFRMKEMFGNGLDDMSLTLYAPAYKGTLQGAVSAANFVKPCYNRTWNGTNTIFTRRRRKECQRGKHGSFQ